MICLAFRYMPRRALINKIFAFLETITISLFWTPGRLSPSPCPSFTAATELAAKASARNHELVVTFHVRASPSLSFEPSATLIGRGSRSSSETPRRNTMKKPILDSLVNVIVSLNR